MMPDCDAEKILSLPALNALSVISIRIEFLSQLFLGKPYIANPQGEGINAEFDSAPLFRFDGFDCVTYVNNILALALTGDVDSFQKKLVQINYYDAVPRYENRFHFTSLDWNPQNQKNEMMRDITGDILDQRKVPLVLLAEGEIDKPNWFLKKAESESADRAALLKKYASRCKKENARIAYLPLNKLFDENKKPCIFIFDQIPDVSIIEIVRPNWNLKDKIGTNLHVSHMGFCIRKPSGELFFHHASSENKSVVAILLSDYLKSYLDSPTIKGINIEVVVMTTHHASCAA